MKHVLIHFTDPHLCPPTHTPAARTDEFHAQIRSKWQALTAIIQGAINNTHGTVTTLMSGDLYHLKTQRDYGPDSTNKYANWLDEIPGFVHMIPGNHDLPRSNMGYYEQTAYRITTRAAHRVIDHGIHFSITPDDTKGLYSAGPSEPRNSPWSIAGLPYLPIEELLTHLPRLDAALSQAASGRVRVAMLHPDAAPLGARFPGGHILIPYDEILNRLPNVNILVLGHIHQAFPIYQRQHPTSGLPQIVSKPWSFTRTTNDDYVKAEVLEQQHHPSVCVIVLDTDTGQLTAEYSVIPHTPFAEAFDPPKLLQITKAAVQKTSFIEELRAQFGGNATNAFNLQPPEEWLAKQNIPQEVREMIQHYVQG